jgi:hypothetical protein
MDTVIGPDTFCASACADIWLAGSRRFIAPSGHVGFHGSSLYGRRSEDGDNLVRGYYKEIGISPAAAEVLLSPDPDDVLWLSDGRARRLGIVALDWPPKGAPAQSPRVAAKPEPQPPRAADPYPHEQGRLQNGTVVPSLKVASIVTCDYIFACVEPVEERANPKISIASVPQEQELPLPKYDGRVPQESPSFEPYYEPHYDYHTMIAWTAWLVLALFCIGIGAVIGKIYPRVERLDHYKLPPPLPSYRVAEVQAVMAAMEKAAPPSLSHAVGCAAVGAALQAAEAAEPILKPNPRSPWYVPQEA